ncbi:MAG: conjugal transfer protein TraF [Nitrospiria bacterium]
MNKNKKFSRTISRKGFYLAFGIIVILMGQSTRVHAESTEEPGMNSTGIIPTKIAEVKQADLEVRDIAPQRFEGSYYQRLGEGWFWYIDPKPLKKRKDPGDALKRWASIKVEPKDLKPGWPEFATGDEIHAYQKMLLNNAVIDPTMDKVKKYLEFQKYIMSKSRLFSDVAMRVIWDNPELDQSAQKPRADYAREAVFLQSKEEVSRKMARVAREGGIFFIFSSTCPYCRLEAPILKQFETTFGIKVVPVSIDGEGLPEYPKPALDHGIASALNVNVTPTLFFGLPPKEIHRIANGFVTFDELTDRVISLFESQGESR